MNQLTQITSAPFQRQTVILVDGTSFDLTIYFIPLQQGWFITELNYTAKSFILRGLRITNNVNMLNQWRNIIPFGLGCISTANREPALQQDFSSQASKLYLLTQAECEQYAEYLRS